MAERPPLSPVQTSIRLVVGATGLVFVAGMFVGFFQAMAEHGGNILRLKPLLALGVFSLVGVGLIALMIDAIRRRAPADGPVAPREQRSRMLFWLSLALGLLIGVFGSISGLFDSLRDPVAHPINPLFGAILLVLLVVVMPPLTWFWHRSIDEHERSTYRDGAMMAAYAYIIIVPIWWVGARVGLLPPVDGISVFFAFNFIFLAVWLWRRYR